MPGRKRQVPEYVLIVLTALFLGVFCNTPFYSKVLKEYPLSLSHGVFMLSLLVVLASLTVFLLTLVSSRRTTKPVLIAVLLVSSVTCYFMNTYNVVMDDRMLQNVLQTNAAEAMDLMSAELLLYFLLLGVLPSALVYLVPVRYCTLRRELAIKLKVLVLSLVFIAVPIMAQSQTYASFFREHKPLRYYANPTYWIYSVGTYLGRNGDGVAVALAPIGQDARIHHVAADDDDEKELVVLVVGEAARADRFSLNGYGRETNPLLKKEDVVSFSRMYSCGTSTAVSVPCMFSFYDREHFSPDKALHTENILDVLVHTGSIDILWRDNNSDSKGTAVRVPYEDFKSSSLNPVCEGECRDEGMLSGLDGYIQRHKGRDILIVLHMMGNHGPAYYKRYPGSFEIFTPVCATNQLEECTPEAIGNTYDNAVLYTDYFLSKVIGFLKQYSETHETALFYISDHGESLGENGLYLHGLPYFMAPETQTHVASLMWVGGRITKEIDPVSLKKYSDRQLSHDNLFHTLLGFFEVETELYDPGLDILQDAATPLHARLHK